MSTRSIAVNGDTMFHEFVIVWEHRETRERSLHTGSTICGVDSDGHWSWLREYFDPADRQRASALALPGVSELISPS